jgi:hypothetical protein
MFRAGFPLIIRSSKTVHAASGNCQTSLLLPLAWLSRNSEQSVKDLFVGRTAVCCENRDINTLCGQNVVVCVQLGGTCAYQFNVHGTVHR